jgi:hypothetical protein
MMVSTSAMRMAHNTAVDRDGLASTATAMLAISNKAGGFAMKAHQALRSAIDQQFPVDIVLFGRP